METIKTEKQLYERSVVFLEKLSQLILSEFNYDLSKVNDEFTNKILETAYSDHKLMHSEVEFSKLLFNYFTDEEIIESIKPTLIRTTRAVFANCKGVPEKLTKNLVTLVKIEKLSRYIDIDNLNFDMKRNPNNKSIIMDYYIHFIESAPYTTVLSMMIMFNRMKRDDNNI